MFQLIAIRPLIGCDIKYRRVLQLNKIYKFYNGYNFVYQPIQNSISDETSQVEKIIPNEHLVSETFYNGQDKPLINISAVVGKNGSGKSTLFEMFYIAIYIIAMKKGILRRNPTELQKEIERIEKNKRIEPTKKEKCIEELRIEKSNIEDIYNKFAAEFFYRQGPSFFSLRIEKGKIQLKVLNGAAKQDKTNDIIENLDFIETFDFNDFFYTISVNYSLYGLNENHIGHWIKSLFHKNDGYKTPIVINPYREEGNIDINVENELVDQRLLSTILELKESEQGAENSLRNLAPGKIAKTLIAKFDNAKDEDAEKHLANVLNAGECFQELYKAYTKGAILPTMNDPVLKHTEMYGMNKLIKICRSYDDYKEFLTGKRFKKIPSLVSAILDDNSHITFKLKQAINFIHYQHFYNLNSLKLSEEFEIDIEKQAVLIKDIRIEALEKDKNLSTIVLLPPPIFNYKIRFENKSHFNDLSSGEKQRIYSISSIVYHIININSVFESGNTNTTDRNKYSHINLMFDEVELYFHPEYQRTFISDLIAYVNKIDTSQKKHIDAINIVFSTHSPFILSDIPSENVLMLEIDPETKLSKTRKPNGCTFGANIHELLSDSFFMNSSIGEAANNKINKITNFHFKVKNASKEQLNVLKSEYERNKAEFDFITRNIGEDVIRGILENHLTFIDEILNSEVTF